MRTKTVKVWALARYLTLLARKGVRFNRLPLSCGFGDGGPAWGYVTPKGIAIARGPAYGKPAYAGGTPNDPAYLYCEVTVGAVRYGYLLARTGKGKRARYTDGSNWSL